MKLVFVSSTFKDMQFERDRLHSHVVPQIDDSLSKYGESVYFGDLRWGVNTSGMDGEESSQKVLSVCLDEIDGCKPYMIVLIGERYGWIPEEVLIKETATLKGIDVPTDISVTQLEIEYGALLNPDLEGRVMFYFRELDTTGMTESQLADYKGESPLHTQKIQQLKDRILQTYPNQVRTYTAKWDSSTQSVVGLDGLMQQIQEDLQRVFLKDIQKENSIPWQQRAMNASSKRFWEEAQNYYPVVRMADPVGNGPYSAEHHHLTIINGEIGSGKSAFIANKYYQYAQHPRYADKIQLVPFVFGLDDFSSNGENLIKLMIFQGETLLNLPHQEISPEEKLTEDHFERLLALEKQLKYSPLVVFVDNANDEIMGLLAHLYQRYEDWRPNYPVSDPYVTKYYVAYNEVERGCLSYPMFDFAKRYTTRPLAQGEKQGFIEALIKGKHKELSNIVCQHILQKKQSSNPFYLKLLVERLLMLDSNDFAEIRKMGDGMEAINSYMISIVDNVADSVSGIVKELANEAGQRIDFHFVCRLLAILSCSNEFLQEEEIKQIFAHQNWQYTTLNMSLTTKTLKGFLTVRANERKYKIVNPQIAKYLREYTWEQGYKDMANIMANFAKNQPQTTSWYIRAFDIATYTYDADFASQVFTEIYLAEHPTSLHKTIQNALCKGISRLLQETIKMEESVMWDASKLSRDEVPFVAQTIFNIVTTHPNINYTPLLKYVYVQLGSNVQNTSVGIALIQVKQRLDKWGKMGEHMNVDAFYIYVNCIIARILHKVSMESSYFLQEANKIKNGSYKTANYRTLTDLTINLHYLERGVYQDTQQFVDQVQPDPSKYFYLEEELKSSPEKEYVNSVQKGHAYHTLYQIHNYGETPQYDLIDKALECYESINWDSKVIQKFLTIEDMAQIIQAYVDCITSYDSEKSKATIAKLKDKIPFYLQKSKQLFETNVLDNLIPQILVSERIPEEMTDEQVEQVSDLYMRAISRQSVADAVLQEVHFDRIITFYTNYLNLFDNYDNFAELDFYAQNMQMLLGEHLSKPIPNADKTTPDKFSMTLTKHFFSLTSLLDRLELNENFDNMEILLADFYARLTKQGAKSPLISQIIVVYFMHRYLPYDEDTNYGGGYYGAIYKPKEQTFAMLCKMMDAYDKTNGGAVRVMPIATATAEVQYYQQIMQFIKDNLFDDEDEEE